MSSDHDRILNSGALFGVLALAAGMGWAEAQLPQWAAFLLTWAVVLPVIYAMACWKRAWYGWLIFWGFAALCIISGAVQVVTPWLDRPESAGCLAFAIVFVFLWYWIIRAPRRRVLLPAVSHVVHHHVFHVPGAAALPPAGVSLELPDPVPPAIPGRLVRAIEAPQRVPAWIGDAVRRERT